MFLGNPNTDKVPYDLDEWREDAACRNTDPDLFFPVGTTGAAIDQIEAAKKVCGDCLARGACLQFALETNQEAGIWGGTSEDERRKVRRVWLTQRRRNNAGATAGQIASSRSLTPPTH